MRLRSLLAVLAMVAGQVFFPSVASADNAEANCVMRKDGETKESASGPCSFSQRQGYIDINLRNGTTYSLSPGDKPDHFRDQDGKKVVRTVDADGRHEYKWEGKKIIVTFAAGPAGGKHHSSTSASPSSAAESACMVAVNGNYGGKVKSLTVANSEPLPEKDSTVVMLRADGEHWRCVASNDGKVKDLSVKE